MTDEASGEVLKDEASGEVSGLLTEETSGEEGEGDEWNNSGWC